MTSKREEGLTKKYGEMRPVSIYISDLANNALNALVRKNKILSRSDGVRRAISDFLVSEVDLLRKLELLVK